MLTGADVDKMLTSLEDWEERDGQWFDEYGEKVDKPNVLLSTYSYKRKQGFDEYEPAEDEDLEDALLSEERDVVFVGVGTFNLEVQWGGQGDGAPMGYVIKFTPVEGDPQWFEKTGYYSSWDSNYFDGGWKEVEPFEKTVTRYKKVVR